MIAIGTPYCTERLIVPTSRVTRVTRSPVLALSTRPSGSRRIVADDVLARGGEQVLAEQRRGALGEEREQRLRDHDADDQPARARRGRRRPASTVRSTRSPSSRGTTSPAPAASALSTTRATKMPAPLADQLAEEGQHGAVAGDRPAALGVAGGGVDPVGPLAAQVVAQPPRGEPLADGRRRPAARSRGSTTGGSVAVVAPGRGGGRRAGRWSSRHLLVAGARATTAR